MVRINCCREHKVTWKLKDLLYTVRVRMLQKSEIINTVDLSMYPHVTCSYAASDYFYYNYPCFSSIKNLRCHFHSWYAQLVVTMSWQLLPGWQIYQICVHSLCRSRLISSNSKFLVVVSPFHQHLMDVTKPLLRMMSIGDFVIPQYIYVQSRCHPRCSDDHA